MGRDGQMDVLLFTTSGAEGGAGAEAARGTCEFLVTLRGERRENSGGAVPASHKSVEPRQGDDLSQEREEALRDALARLGVDADAVVASSDYDGSSCRRAYNTFVNPRKGKVGNKVETIEEAAVRAATQIAMLDREHRAMLADYLRNSDAARSAAEAGLGRELNPIVLVLDNVRSVHNVGSILRTAETAGVAEVVTTGITPHPPHPKVDSQQSCNHGPDAWSVIPGFRV